MLALAPTDFARVVRLTAEGLASFTGRVVPAEFWRDAGRACATLIAHCLEHGLEPLWACRKGNVGSVRLALGLGFVEVRRQPYYELAAAPRPSTAR